MTDLLLKKFSGWLTADRNSTGMATEERELKALDAKLRCILPPEYQNSYDEVEPVSMGSAGLKYDAEGKVAWDEIWGSFCDLAMAGGPPHKGKLLEPGTAEEIAAAPEKYRAVVDEICRGIRMVSYEVAVEPSPHPGWIRVMCPNKVMAGWLARAIVMENVSARLKGDVVELPAGPQYRLPKEIKNVITVIAKTCHYYEGHMGWEQQRAIAAIFAEAEGGRPLLQPSFAEEDEQRLQDLKPVVSAKLRASAGLQCSGVEYRAWLGVEAGSVRAAIWMMRALVVSNVLARREGTLLYVPLDAAADPEGELIVNAVVSVHRLAVARGVLRAGG